MRKKGRNELVAKSSSVVKFMCWSVIDKQPFFQSRRSMKLNRLIMNRSSEEDEQWVKLTNND